MLILINKKVYLRNQIYFSLIYHKKTCYISLLIFKYSFVLTINAIFDWLRKLSNLKKGTANKKREYN